MKLLSPPGSNMLGTTQHMPRAIRLPPVSRYLRPSSYFRHALLLWLYISPLNTHTYTYTLNTFGLLLYRFVSFCSCEYSTLWTSCALLLCRSLLRCFYLCSYLWGRTLWQLITHHYCLAISLLPLESLNFGPPLAASLPSLRAARLIRNILKITVQLPELQFQFYLFVST